MTYTGHGFHIPGSPIELELPLNKERCGGLRLCGKCIKEAANYITIKERMSDMTQLDMQFQAKLLVMEYFNRKQTSAELLITTDEVHISWFSKTLQNWKALLITRAPNGIYYEITYNGDDKEAYIDVYQKIDNVVVPFAIIEEENRS